MSFNSSLMLKKYQNALKGFANIYNNAKQKEKHRFMYPIRSAGITWANAKKLGFKVTHWQWSKCFDRSKRNKGGRKPLNEILSNQINTYMESISSIAANRYLKKIDKNAYYCNISLLEAYSKFGSNNQLSFSTFYKYLGPQFKKPHRFSDLCEYCENNKTLKKEMINLLSMKGYDGELEDLSQVKQFFSHLASINRITKNEYKSYLSLVQNIEAVKTHRLIATRQSSAYRNNISELTEESIFIDIDWKQKVLIGMSPNQVSQEYRNQQQRTLIGFGIFYKDSQNELECLNIDLVSNNQSQTGYDTINAFRFLRQLEIFQNIEKKKYIVWTDTGNHFRCAELMHFLFVELASVGIEVSYNLFCEKHGKNSRDQHFSIVSNFIQQESFVKQLTSSKDICDAIEKHQTFANIDKERMNSLQKSTTKKFKKTLTKAYVIPEHSSPYYTSFTLTVEGLRNYYNFFTDSSFHLKTHLMSDQENFIRLESKIASVRSSINVNQSIDMIEPITVKSTYLNRKIQNWKIMQRERTNKLNNSEFLSDYSFDSSIINNNEFCVAHKCSTCNIKCNFRLSELNSSNMFLTQAKVNDELKNHGHPKSRRNKDRNKTMRTLTQALMELKIHYLSYHKN